MKTKVNREKVIAATATALLFIAFSSTVYFGNKNRSLEKGLTDQKIKSEHLLSEKLVLEKQLAVLKGDLIILTGEKTTMSAKAADLYNQITQKEKELDKIKITESNITSLQKKVKELKLAKQALEDERSSLGDKLSIVENENRQLNNTMVALRNENKLLIENMERLSLITADNFRIETRKMRKEKLTVIAKNTKKMVVSFDVPQNVAANVSFKITTPDGKIVSSHDEGITFEVLSDDDLYASAQTNSNEIEVAKRIKMTYKPKQKMSTGVYKIEILNNDKRMGACQVNLR